MLDIPNLERRWLKYKIKRYAPIGASVFIFSVSAVIALLWFNTSDMPKSAAKKPIITKTVTIPKTPIAIEDTRIALEPSMEFVQAFEKESLSTIPLNTSRQTVLKTSQPIIGAVPPPQVIKVPELSNSMTAAGAVSAPSDKSLSINRNESKLDIEGLQRRFKETSNANLGLFIARYYYDQGNFNEAYNYALRTNTLNSKIDESWLIFSKSLVKLGKSDQAKKTLQLYISQSGSETAKILLDSIEKGNFK